MNIELTDEEAQSLVLLLGHINPNNTHPLNNLWGTLEEEYPFDYVYGKHTGNYHIIRDNAGGDCLVWVDYV